MSIRKNYKHTITACCIAGIVQAVIVNFSPLLFLTFQTNYGVSLGRLGLLVLINFGTQLLVDLISVKLVDKIGYRAAIVASHAFSTLGLLLLGILPECLPAPYVGLCIATVAFGIGGGLAEVLTSPIVEACPTNKKSAVMSLLHSFFCWGSAAVILISTLALHIFGLNNWRYISFAWAILPFLNGIYFLLVPINRLVDEGESTPLRDLLSSKLFWIFILLMLCSGAAELSISQWVSAFAESGLKVSKTVGDIAGPCLFALCMGLGRVLQAKITDRMSLTTYLLISAIVCIVGYLIVALVPIPVLALLGCGICGFAVASMWPGTLSLAAKRCPKGGTALFALLALAGDCGASIGPVMVGFVSGKFENSLNIGLGISVVFPLILLVGLLLLRVIKSEKNTSFTKEIKEYTGTDE